MAIVWRAQTTSPVCTALPGTNWEANSRQYAVPAYDAAKYCHFSLLMPVFGWCSRQFSAGLNGSVSRFGRQRESSSTGAASVSVERAAQKPGLCIFAARSR